MKTKFLALQFAGCLVALAAWYVYAPRSVPSVAVPPTDSVKETAAQEKPDKNDDPVNKGLKFLVENQFPDGHWEGDGGQHPVAMTGLVGLALLMDKNERNEIAIALRNTPGEADGKYAANFPKAVDWLIDKGQPERDGLIFSEHESETARYMEGHGLATLFLAGARTYESNDEREKKLSNTLMRAVKYIVKARSTQGGWYHTSRAEGHDLDDFSATVIQLQALHAAANAGIPVPDAVINEAQEYLKRAVGKYDQGAASERDQNRHCDTAAALVCHYNSNPFRGMDISCPKWLEYCQSEIPVGAAVQFGRDELTHYYFAQALSFRHQHGGGKADWDNYHKAIFDRLQSSQDKDGSWPAGNGLCVGRVYSTALWCIILQLDKKSHPSMRRSYEID